MCVAAKAATHTYHQPLWRLVCAAATRCDRPGSRLRLLPCASISCPICRHLPGYDPGCLTPGRWGGMNPPPTRAPDLSGGIGRHLHAHTARAASVRPHRRPEGGAGPRMSPPATGAPRSGGDRGPCEGDIWALLQMSAVCEPGTRLVPQPPSVDAPALRPSSSWSLRGVCPAESGHAYAAPSDGLHRHSVPVTEELVLARHTISTRWPSEVIRVTHFRKESPLVGALRFCVSSWMPRSVLERPSLAAHGALDEEGLAVASGLDDTH